VVVIAFSSLEVLSFKGQAGDIIPLVACLGR